MKTWLVLVVVCFVLLEVCRGMEAEIRIGSDSSGESESPPSKKIQGKIRLGGEDYKTICECSAADEPSDLCVVPAKIRIFQELHNGDAAVDKAAIKQLLGEPAEITLLDADLEGMASLDSRNPELVLGTPGGEFCEFIIALSTFEQLLGENLNRKRVERILVDWILWDHRMIEQPFTLYTDEQAVERLKKHVGSPLDLSLESPDLPMKQKRKLLETLVSPQGQGCQFLRALLQSPQLFHVRPELINHVITAFFRVLWDFPNLASDRKVPHKMIKVVVLEGKRQQAQAWINFRASEHCEGEHKFPSIRPHSEQMSVIVNHPKAAAGLRNRLGNFLALRNDHLSSDRLVHRLRRRGTLSMELLAELLGKGIPFFTVVVE